MMSIKESTDVFGKYVLCVLDDQGNEVASITSEPRWGAQEPPSQVMSGAIMIRLSPEQDMPFRRTYSEGLPKLLKELIKQANTVESLGEDRAPN